MIKLLVILDEKISEDASYKDEINNALILQNEEYKLATEGNIQIEHIFSQQNLSSVPWVDYWGGNYGFSYSWLQQDTKNRGDFYSIAYVIDDEHWSKLGMTSGIWGWHAGFFNGYSIQLIRAQKGSVKYVPALGKTASTVFFGFYEELMHSWDDLLYSRLQVDLDTFFGVTDYDETIVHGADTKDTWLRWRYQEAIKKIEPFLIQLFNEKPMYKYAIDENQNQHILYTDLKIDIEISDVKDLDKLVINGLTGAPEQILSSELNGYYKIVGVEKARFAGLMKDLFNL